MRNTTPPPPPPPSGLRSVLPPPSMYRSLLPKIAALTTSSSYQRRPHRAANPRHSASEHVLLCSDMWMRRAQCTCSSFRCCRLAVRWSQISDWMQSFSPKTCICAEVYMARLPMRFSADSSVQFHQQSRRAPQDALLIGWQTARRRSHRVWWPSSLNDLNHCRQ